MSGTNKELDPIKDQVASETRYNKWDNIPPFERDTIYWSTVCELYATEKAKELLPKEKKEPTNYSTDPVLIKYEYSEPQEKEQTYSSEFVGVLQRLISKLSTHNKNLFEEIERLKAEVLREKFPPN